MLAGILTESDANAAEEDISEIEDVGSINGAEQQEGQEELTGVEQQETQDERIYNSSGTSCSTNGGQI